MRLLILQDHLRCGGTERQSVHLARTLRAGGHDVALVCFRPGGPLASEVPASVPHRALQPRDTGLNWLVPGLTRAVRRAAPEVVLCMGRMASLYGGALQLRFPELTVVGSVRTGKPLTRIDLWALRRVSGVVVNTVWWREALIARGLDPARIAVVPNGLARAWAGRRRAATRADTRRRLGVPASTVVFLNVAGFRRGKRQAHLIELFAALDPTWDCQLWLVGDGAERARCARRAAGLIEAGRVRLMGHRPDPYAYYAGADVAVSASVEDSLPNFLVEAQSLGLPVVATDYRGVGEAIREGETGYLVGSDDSRRFVEALGRFYHRPELRRSFGRRAERFAAEHCASERQVERTLEALRGFRAGCHPVAVAGP